MLPWSCYHRVSPHTLQASTPEITSSAIKLLFFSFRLCNYLMCAWSENQRAVSYTQSKSQSLKKQILHIENLNFFFKISFLLPFVHSIELARRRHTFLSKTAMMNFTYIILISIFFLPAVLCVVVCCLVGGLVLLFSIISQLRTTLVVEKYSLIFETSWRCAVDINRAVFLLFLMIPTIEFKISSEVLS